MTNNKQQTEINAVEYLDKVNQFAKENNTGKPKQTAVEWLVIELKKLTECDFSYEDIYMKAKEMEKEQIVEAHQEGQLDERDYWTIGDSLGKNRMVKSQMYYEQTYGGNK
jgi:hypothetical protein